MMRSFWALALSAISLAALTTTATAQLNLLNPVPGGATGANVSCLQAGDLNSGAFVRMFLQTGPGAWEAREFPRLSIVKLDEKRVTMPSVTSWSRACTSLVSREITTPALLRE